MFLWAWDPFDPAGEGVFARRTLDYFSLKATSVRLVAFSFFMMLRM